MLSRLRTWSRNTLANLPSVIPSSCALCGCDAPDAICSGCHTDFFARHQHRCEQCALPLKHGDASLCGNCLRKPPAFDATIVAADYAPPVDQLVLALKFGSHLALAPLLADMLHDAIATSPLAAPAILTAVPLGQRRLEERGFNQSLEVAKPLSRRLGIRLDARLIQRQRDTRAQALLHPDERYKNIHRAFMVPAEAIDRVRGQHIGVVDDVMTTGETLNALAETLKRFGAVRVTNLVFARTLPS